MNYFVTGTGTDIGKTIITALLADFLSIENRRYFPYKPIQTGAIKVKGKLLAPDPEVYKLIGDQSGADDYYTYLLQLASSPHLAAEKENVLYELGNIHRDIQKIGQNNDGVIVEGAGGLYVPITAEGYCMIDLIKELSFPVILVADAGLGTINHTGLSVKALQSYNIPIAGIILNKANQANSMLERDNMKMIERLTGVPIVGTVPYAENIQGKLQEKEQRKILTKSWNRNIIESGGIE